MSKLTKRLDAILTRCQKGSYSASESEIRTSMSRYDEMVECLKVSKDRIEELEAIERVLKFTVLGWREWDWPEGFDRRTAGMIADAVSQQLDTKEDKG